jgi:hypothetical protein
MVAMLVMMDMPELTEDSSSRDSLFPTHLGQI